MTALSDRELDAEVARKVMNLRLVKPTARRPMTMNGCRISWGDGTLVVDTGEKSTWGNRAEDVPTYSRRIALAFLVVEEMRRRGSVVIVKIDGLRAGDHPTPYTVLIGNHPRVDGASLPRCICLAALAAKGA